VEFEPARTYYNNLLLYSKTYATNQALTKDSRCFNIGFIFFGELVRVHSCPQKNRGSGGSRELVSTRYQKHYYFELFFLAVFLLVLLLRELFFFVADFLGADFFEADFFLPVFFFAAFLDGTFCPFSRASDIPMAIACLRLVTFLPLRPLVSVPFFLRRKALPTVLFAFF
jgi:hypothetical protein